MSKKRKRCDTLGGIPVEFVDEPGLSLNDFPSIPREGFAKTCQNEIEFVYPDYKQFLYTLIRQLKKENIPLYMGQKLPPWIKDKLMRKFE
jgi:hypothetical protein